MSDEVVVTKEVEIPLSEKEILEHAQEGADLRALIDEQQKELDDLTKGFKEEQRKHNESINQKEERRAALDREVKAGKGKRAAKCLVTYEAGVARYYWPHDAEKENQHMVFEREMDPEEYQLTLVEDKATSEVAETGQTL